MLLVVCWCVGVVPKPQVLQSVDQAPKGQKGLAGHLSQRWVQIQAASWVQGYAPKGIPTLLLVSLPQGPVECH